MKELCRAKRHILTKSVSKEVELTLESVDDTVAALSSGVVDVAEFYIDKLTRPLASTRANVTSLTAKLFGLDETCN